MSCTARTHGREQLGVTALFLAVASCLRKLLQSYWCDLKVKTESCAKVPDWGPPTRAQGPLGRNCREMWEIFNKCCSLVGKVTGNSVVPMVTEPQLWLQEEWRCLEWGAPSLTLSFKRSVKANICLDKVTQHQPQSKVKIHPLWCSPFKVKQDRHIAR